VAVIKDAELRKIAFERLLEAALPLGQTRRSDKDVKHARTTTNTHSAKAKNKTSAFYSEAQVRQEVQGLGMSGTVKGLPQFREAKKGWEQYMWVLAAAKAQRLEGLNNHEIAFLLTKRLYRPTKYSTVNNIHSKVSAGLVCQDPETQCWMITPDGEVYLGNLLNGDKVDVKLTSKA